jgi:hypothetical protein
MCQFRQPQWGGQQTEFGVLVANVGASSSPGMSLSVSSAMDAGFAIIALLQENVSERIFQVVGNSKISQEECMKLELITREINEKLKGK